VSGDYHSKLTLIVESLAQRWGRILVRTQRYRFKPPGDIPEADRDLILVRKDPSYGNSFAAHLSHRALRRTVCRRRPRCRFSGRGRGISILTMRSNGSALDDSASATETCFGWTRDYRRGRLQIAYAIYIPPCTTHWGSLVYYRFMSELPSLFVIGEAQFLRSWRKPSRRCALMQGLGLMLFLLCQHFFSELSGRPMGKRPSPPESPEFETRQSRVSPRQD